MSDTDETRDLQLEIRTNAVRYWEIRRLYFNAAPVTPALVGYCAFFFLQDS